MPERVNDAYLWALKRAALDCIAQFDSAVTLSDEPEVEDVVACLRDLPSLVDELIEHRAASAAGTEGGGE